MCLCCVWIRLITAYLLCVPELWKKKMHFLFNFDACPMHSPFGFVHLMHQNLSARALFCHNSLPKVNMQLSIYKYLMKNLNSVHIFFLILKLTCFLWIKTEFVTNFTAWIFYLIQLSFVHTNYRTINTNYKTSAVKPHTHHEDPCGSHGPKHTQQKSACEIQTKLCLHISIIRNTQIK